MNQPKQPETNGLAIASLVLGILSVTGFSVLTGIPAVITGLMGLKKPDGRGMSIAGIIMGGISIVFAVILILFFIVVFALTLASDNDTRPGLQRPTIDSESSREQRI